MQHAAAGLPQHQHKQHQQQQQLANKLQQHNLTSNEG